MSTARLQDDPIVQACARLAAGDLLVFPTETVYGLGADAASAAAVERIYALKGRPRHHPLIVHVHDVAQAKGWAVFDARASALVRVFWPGPLTLVLPRQPAAPGWACAHQASIALRCPAHPVAQALLAAWAQAGGCGIAAPSANRFGRVSPTCVAHVRADLGAQTPFMLEGGAAEVGVESTILDLTRAQPVLLRPGRITAAQIAQVLGVPVGAQDAAAPRVSGSLPAHYQPQTPVELWPEGALPARLVALGARDLIVWAPWCESWAQVKHWEPWPASAHECEYVLYDCLRRLDALQATRILIVEPPKAPEWDAVHDRLSRAAGLLRS